MRGLRPSRSSCAATDAAAQERMAELVKVFSPGMQAVAGRNARECFTGNFPTLAEVEARIRPGAAEAWIVAQLTALARNANMAQTPDKGQLMQTASTIAAEYGYLKLTEVLLFFHRFNAGQYGKFYGSVSPIQITASLREFLRERDEALWQVDNLRRMAERDEDRLAAVSHEDFLRMKEAHERAGDYDEWVAALAADYKERQDKRLRAAAPADGAEILSAICRMADGGQQTVKLQTT